MLAVILEFDVKEGLSEEFVSAWAECTNVIYQNFGSLGSRLHRAENGTFIAYAQWPHREAYERSDGWPEDLAAIRNRLRATLKTGKPTVLHKLQLEIDLLRNETSKKIP